MAKQDLALLEKKLLQKIMSGSDEFRLKYSNYHEMVIHNSDSAIIKQATIQIARREAYSTIADFKQGLVKRLGKEEGNQQYRAIIGIIKDQVPKFNAKVYNLVLAESQKKKGKWVITWINKMD